MTYGKRAVSDEILARIITPVALYPRAYSNIRLARETRLATSTISAAIGELTAREWLSGERLCAVPERSGRPRELHETTGVFEDTVHRVVDHIRDDAPEREADLFVQAVAYRRRLDKMVAEDLRDSTAAGYLGRVVLLGEAGDLGKTGWLSGAAGWRALVEIAADRPLVPEADISD